MLITLHNKSSEFLVNTDTITYITSIGETTRIYFIGEDYLDVTESKQQILMCIP